MMIELITEIITRYGPRKAGSEAEKQAQLFIAERCQALTDKVQFMPFEGYLDARFGKLKYYVGLFFISLGLHWFSPLAALLVSVVNVFFLVFDLMMFRNILPKFPGGAQTSWNVEATLEPQGPVKSTIVVSGHMDSTREYTWWYKLGEAGVKLTVFAGILMVLQSVYNLAYFIYPLQPAGHYVWAVFVLLSPVTVVYWAMHGPNAVPGAQDNLSGIAIAHAVFTGFAHPQQKGVSTLQNTRLKFVSFGSEERGLCGSRAYVAEHVSKLKEENAHIVNIDSVRLVSEVAVVEHESMNGTRHTPALVKGLQQSFTQNGAPYKTVKLPIGGTDAVAFARHGLPSVSIIGISTKNYDFTYHTRHDVVENIEPESLENVRQAISGFIQQWDKE